MKKDQLRPLVLVAILGLLLMITRGSHAGSAFSLPDATLAVMMLGGLLLQRGTWFAAALAACVVVDVYAVGVLGVSAYCLSPAYWALAPTYGVMWLGGRWLSKRADAFTIAPYAATAIITTSLAFVLSTHSFYLFSGRFAETPVWEVMKYGWEYYPAYLGYTLMYLAAAWVVQRLTTLVSQTSKVPSAQ